MARSTISTVLALLTIGFGWGQHALGQTILLPIEVMPTEARQFRPQSEASDNYYMETRQFNLTGSAVALSGGKLYIQGHGLGYRDGHIENNVLSKDAKASVWLGADPNDPRCPWVKLKNDDANIEFTSPEAYYEKIGGGFRTVRLKIDLTAFERPDGTSCLASGKNMIRFGFNGTDGTSSGYRILAFNLLDSNDLPLLGEAAFTQDDPMTWGPPLRPDGNPAQSPAGKTLFNARNSLSAQPGRRAPILVAACADCHAWDGRDLQYFAYSNKSIINRAIFHGLSPTEAADIAAYIRTRQVDPRGRPWNPPYQPGPGLDARGAAGWAAGAGLSAVLDHEMDQNASMLTQLFGTDTPTEADILQTIQGVGLPAETINVRELPIAIQLPDWNSWLPEVHPLDMWGEGYWPDESNSPDGPGDFKTQIAFEVSNNPISIAVGHFDDNNTLDLAVVANPSTGKLNLLTHVEDESYEQNKSLLNFNLQSYDIHDSPRAIATGDFNGDEHLDLAVLSSGTDHYVTIYLRDTQGQDVFTPQESFAVGRDPQALVIEDFNSDEALDLAVTNRGDDTVTIFQGKGNGDFRGRQQVQVGSGPHGMTTGDFNSDGKPDLAVTSFYSNDVRIVLNQASGFESVQSLTVGLQPISVAVGDFNDDGIQDLAVANAGSDNVSILQGKVAGDGTFRVATTIPVDDFPTSIVAVDLTGDDVTDLAVTHQQSNNVGVLHVNEAGTFDPMTTFEAGTNPVAMTVGDFDKNGRPDLAVVNAGSGNVSVIWPYAFKVEETYHEIRDQLATMAQAAQYPYDELPQTLAALMQTAKNFVGLGMYAVPGTGTLDDGWRGHRGLVLDVAVLRGYNHEFAKRNLAQWIAVKYWELMQDFGLETYGPDVFGAQHGERLSWPTGGSQSVHPIAPHITSVNDNNFTSEFSIPEADACGDLECDNQMHAEQTRLKGDYDSTAWYHLQLILHAGARSLNHGLSAAPVDVGYAYKHIDELAHRAAPDDLTGPWEGLRYLATMIKVYQMRNNHKGPFENGWSMRDISPRLLVSNFGGKATRTELWEKLETYQSNLWPKAANALLQVFVDTVTNTARTPSFARDVWPRCGGRFMAGPDEDPQEACNKLSAVRQTWATVDPADYQVSITQGMIHDFCPGFFTQADPTVEPINKPFPTGYYHHADHIYRAIPYLIVLGVHQEHISRLIDWAERMWPGPDSEKNDWGAWRTLAGCPPS